MTAISIPPLVILGTGYTGRVLYRQAVLAHRPVLAASRTPATSLHDLPSAHRLTFDLAQPRSWTSIPDGSDLVWTFPAVSFDAVIACGKILAPRARRLVVLGATSAYDQAPEIAHGGFITESCLVDLSQSRVQGEEWLREKHGAIVLRVAGIYGPGRNPLDWIRKGRVGYSHRFVNLIHVDDLAAVILHALERGTPGERYNVSDGTPRRWSELMDAAAARWGTPKPLPADPTPDKRISNRKLLTELGYTLRYPDLFEALEELERPR